MYCLNVGAPETGYSRSRSRFDGGPSAGTQQMTLMIWSCLKILHCKYSSKKAKESDYIIMLSGMRNAVEITTDAPNQM